MSFLDIYERSLDCYWFAELGTDLVNINKLLQWHTNLYVSVSKKAKCMGVANQQYS